MSDRAVIFDLDGTLVDTAPDLMASVNHVLGIMKRRPVSMPEVRAFVGHGARKLIQRSAAATGDPIDEATLDYYFTEFLRYYERNIAAGSAPFPGAVALLERLSGEGAKLGICTNKLEGLSLALLEALDLTKYFGAVIGPDTINIGKPDARPYFETLRRLGAHRSLMVGDSETDILTARAAEVPVIAVTFGYTPTPVAQFEPDFLVSHFDEMWPIIERTLPA
jgi:phosphoglycolate phosphatase